MSAAAGMSFQELTQGGRTHACLAYWIGPCDVEGLHGVDAGGIARAMSYQYDIEDQSDRTGLVLAPDADWRDHFTPVAPVQLTRAWSPLPYAVEILGTPQSISVGADDVLGTQAAAYVWTAPSKARIAATAADPPDHERFRRLLIVAVTRADRANQGLLIAAKPGWSYEHAHMPSTTGRQLMQRAGFVVTDRHP
jgi:hypothetical protein